MRFVRVASSARAAPIGALLGALGIVAFVAAAWWLRSGLPLPGCALKEWTGVPCPTCGSTRLVRSLAAGRILEAAAWNPLMFGGLIGVALWAVASAVRRLLGWPVWRPVFTRAERLGLWGAVVVAIVANWVWLVLRGA